MPNAQKLGYPNSPLSLRPQTPFETMAAAPCPAYGDLLGVLETEFHHLDLEKLDRRLDELALPLFGLERESLEERAIALGRSAWAAVPDEAGTPSALLLGAALEDGCAAGPVRAALAAELGRRAGVAAHPARVSGCWAVHVRNEHASVAADVGAASDDMDDPGPRGCLCAHQLAFVVLSSLVEAWRSAGNAANARHARVLCLALAGGGGE
jgi:hypothetical protein